MRHEIQPDGSMLEVADVTHCVRCGQPFERRSYTTSWWSCWSCPGTAGHRVYYCLRDGCNGETYDPEHLPQYGPTTDLG